MRPSKANATTAVGDRHRRRSALLFTLLLGSLPMAQAEDMAGHVTEEDFLGEMPIVLSVTRLAQPVAEAPAATTVIDRVMIEMSGARDLVDLLQLVPGMQVARASGHQHIATYHGLSDTYSRRMQVLVDGHSIYTPIVGGVNWSDLPIALADIERIEVIRGPNAATYGANSFQGVISITTRHGSETQGDLVQMAVGSQHIRDGLYRHGGHKGDLDYRVTVGYQEDWGLGDRTDTLAENVPGGSVNRDDNRRIRNLNARADYRLDARDTLMVQLGLSNGPRQEGYWWEEDNNPVRWADHEYHLLEASWVRALEPGSDLSVKFFHSYEDVNDWHYYPSEQFPPITPYFPAAQLADLGLDPSYCDPAYLNYGYCVVGPDRAIVNWDKRSERTEVEVAHTFSPTDTTRLVWGGSLRLDRVQANGFFGTSDPLWDHVSRLFGNLEWRLREDLVLNAGAMVERNDIVGTDVSPRLALNYKFRPEQTLRASVSAATRTPAMIEAYSNWRFCLEHAPVCDTTLLSTEALGPERIVSYELGYNGTFDKRRATLDLKLYRERLQDLITVFRDDEIPTGLSPVEDYFPGAKQWSNADDLTIDGFEAQFDYRLRPRSGVRVSYAYADVESRDRQEDYTLSIPRHTASTMLFWELPHAWEASLTYTFMSGLSWLWTSQDVEIMRRLDLRLAHRWRLARSQATTELVLQNAAGAYDTYSQENRMEPRAYVRVSLHYD